MTFKYIIALVLITAFCTVLITKCTQEPIIKTEYTKVTDTIKETIIKEVPKTVYVQRLKRVKGKDSIVFVDKIRYKKDTSITKANQYETTLKSNKASADLKITTTGELLDVSGVIHYTEKKVTETKAKSGLFIYADMPINKHNTNYALGLAYQIKNKLLIKGSVQHNQFTNGVDISVGVGIKIW